MKINFSSDEMDILMSLVRDNKKPPHKVINEALALMSQLQENQEGQLSNVKESDRTELQLDN